MRVAGSVALVTGASSGIGLATARLLVASGARVVATGRAEDRLAALAAESDRVVPLAADLSTPDGPARLAERALAAAGGRFDIVVNNAGAGWAGPFAAMPTGAFDTMLALNLRAPVTLTMALLPTMGPAGHLVFVGSIAGRLGVREEAGYAAVKAALDTFAESLRLDLAGRDIGVTVVVPGVVDTPFFDRRGTPYRRGVPRPVSAERVAAALVTAIERNRADVYVPGWLRLPVAVRGVAPTAYRRLARRFG